MGGCVHTDISLDSVALGSDGAWKIGGLLQSKKRRPGSSGVIPRPALPGRLRPPEVLLGCMATAKSDIFDLGLTLVEAATGNLLLKPPEGSSGDQIPTLFEELGALHHLLGPLPISLAERCPGKEAICLPSGSFVRAGSGDDVVVEVVQPPTPDPKANLESVLASKRLEGTDAQRLTNLRSFLQKLLNLDAKARCSLKEASEDVFLTGIIKEGEKEPAPTAKSESADLEASAKDEAKRKEEQDKVGRIENDIERQATEAEELLKEGEAALSEDPKHVSYAADTTENEGTHEAKGVLKRVQTGFIKNGRVTDENEDEDEDEDE
jgi:serine/threonine protein kinase